MIHVDQERHKPGYPPYTSYWNSGVGAWYGVVIGVDPRHSGRANSGFLDGHVEPYPYEEIPPYSDLTTPYWGRSWKKGTWGRH